MMTPGPRAGRRHPDATAARTTSATASIAGLDALAGDLVATAVALPRRAPMTSNDVRAAAAALAEMTDALAVISDQLAQQLHTPNHEHHNTPHGVGAARPDDGTGEAIENLYSTRDALVTASSRTRAVSRTLTGSPSASRRPGQPPLS